MAILALGASPEQAAMTAEEMPVIAEGPRIPWDGTNPLATPEPEPWKAVQG